MAGPAAMLLMSNAVQTPPANTVRKKARIPVHTTAGILAEKECIRFMPP
jgi:hypothetical protein